MMLLLIYKILWSVCHATLHTKLNKHDNPPIQTQNNIASDAQHPTDIQAC